MINKNTTYKSIHTLCHIDGSFAFDILILNVCDVCGVDTLCNFLKALKN